MMAKGLTLDGSCTTQAIFGTTWGSKKPDYVKLMKAKEVNDHGLMPDDLLIRAVTKCFSSCAKMSIASINKEILVLLIEFFLVHQAYSYRILLVLLAKSLLFQIDFDKKELF